MLLIFAIESLVIFSVRRKILKAHQCYRRLRLGHSTVRSFGDFDWIPGPVTTPNISQASRQVIIIRADATSFCRTQDLRRMKRKYFHLPEVSDVDVVHFASERVCGIEIQ